MLHEGLFQTLIMNANVWVAFLDEKARIQVWNRAAEEISGYPAGEVVGSNRIWRSLYPDPEYRRRVTETIDGIIGQENQLKNFETRIRTKSGGYRTVSWNTAELADPGGVTMGYIVIGRDITDKVSLNRRFRTLLQNANVWIAFLDKKARIQVWNRAAEVISGYPAGEVVGSNRIWRSLYPDPEYRRQVTETIDRQIGSEQELSGFETEIRARDGERKLISWNTREISDDGGEIEGYVIVGVDETEKKEMQQQIFSYIGESAMRLKNPVEQIRDSISDIARRVRAEEISTQDLVLALRIQQNSADQVVANLRELNEMVALSFSRMPAALKEFLRR